MTLRLAFVGGCLLAFVGGCSTTRGAVRDLASRELACPPDEVSVAGSDATYYQASGCGRSLRIMCHDPNDTTGGSSAANWGAADPLTAGNRVRCESLIDRPASTTTTSATLPKAKTEDARGEFDRPLAAKLLTAAAERAKTCGVAGSVTGTGRAHVTYSPDGAVLAVDLEPPFRETEPGRCVARELSRSSVAAFEGPNVTVVKNFAVDALATPPR